MLVFSSFTSHVKNILFQLSSFQRMLVRVINRSQSHQSVLNCVSVAHQILDT